MTRAADRPRRESTRALIAQFAGFLGPPTLWSAHLLVAYLLVSVGCAIGMVWMRVALGVFSALILAGIAATTIASFVLSEERGEAWWPRDEGDEPRVTFMSHFGVFCGALFFIATLFETAPIYSLNTCG